MLLARQNSKAKPKRLSRGLGLTGVALGIASGLALLTGSVVTYNNMVASSTARGVYISAFNIQQQIRSTTRGGQVQSLPGDLREDHIRIDPVIYDEGDLSIYKLSVRAYIDEFEHGNVMLIFESPPLNECEGMARRIARASSRNFISGCGMDAGKEVMFVGFWGDERGRMAFVSAPPTPPSTTTEDPAGEPAPEEEVESATPVDPIEDAPGEGGNPVEAPVDPTPVDPAPVPVDPPSQGSDTTADAGNEEGGEWVRRNDCWQPFISCSGLGDGTNPGQGSHNNNSQGNGGDGVSNPGSTGGGNGNGGGNGGGNNGNGNGNGGGGNNGNGNGNGGGN